jgi:hypothetical protein
MPRYRICSLYPIPRLSRYPCNCTGSRSVQHATQRLSSHRHSPGSCSHTTPHLRIHLDVPSRSFPKLQTCRYQGRNGVVKSPDESESLRSSALAAVPHLLCACTSASAFSSLQPPPSLSSSKKNTYGHDDARNADVRTEALANAGSLPEGRDKVVVLVTVDDAGEHVVCVRRGADCEQDH